MSYREFRIELLRKDKDMSRSWHKGADAAYLSIDRQRVDMQGHVWGYIQRRDGDVRYPQELAVHESWTVEAPTTLYEAFKFLSLHDLACMLVRPAYDLLQRKERWKALDETWWDTKDEARVRNVMLLAGDYRQEAMLHEHTLISTGTSPQHP